MNVTDPSTTAGAMDLSHAELVMRLHQQELVAYFGVHAMKALTLGAALNEACVIAAGGLRTQFSKVLSYRPESNNLRVVAGIGWREGTVGHAIIGGGLESPAGYALHTEIPVRSNNLSVEDRFRTPVLLLEHGICSAINVAVMGEAGVPFGVLEVDSTRRHEFVDADTVFLQSIGNVLSATVSRLAAEAAKDALLREKDLLMQEVHHRVKNSLQLVRTLLQLQARSASGEVQAKLEEAAQRIMTIGAVHQRLYEGSSVSETEAEPYLLGLFQDMQPMINGEGPQRAIILTSERICLPADDVTPLGLIVSELVTNAAKYSEGPIRVALRRVEAGLEVVVEDNGPGFNGTAEPKGLGMRMVRALAKGDSAQALQVDRTVPYGRVVVLITLRSA